MGHVVAFVDDYSSKKLLKFKGIGIFEGPQVLLRSEENERNSLLCWLGACTKFMLK
jgi:hypothetical protein